MNATNKRMNDFIRGRVIKTQPQQQPPAIANANAGNGTRTDRLPKAPQDMNALIRNAYYQKGTL